MRFAITLFGGSLLDLEFTTDGKAEDRPPFGFQGSGPGVTESIPRGFTPLPDDEE